MYVCIYRIFVAFTHGKCLWVLKATGLCKDFKPDKSIYVLLTVHLSVILDNDQLDTHLLYFTICLL